MELPPFDGKLLTNEKRYRDGCHLEEIWQSKWLILETILE
ncbi:unnamed protein product [Nezara viridula]|uniref:Uncharacterized protein n=1 Tax=Nezara viridula TaxID=85310 RepID=A0A9P0H713_NEZVI|nr:unnamed protein product [Nezara viridula]